MNSARPTMTTNNNPAPRRDLVSEMLPVLCEKFMGSVQFDADGNAIEASYRPADDARHLFDALEALTREQKIRDLRKIRARSEELEESMQVAALGRKVQLVTILVTLYFAELSQAPLLSLVCLIATEQDEIIKAAGAGGSGIEGVLKFGGKARELLDKEVDELVAEAINEGRTPDVEEPRGKGRSTLLRVILAPAGFQVDQHEQEMADLVVIDGVVVKSRYGKCP